MRWHRMHLDGIPVVDLEAAAARPEEVSWFEFWSSRSDYYEGLANDALQNNSTVSCGELLFLACLCIHYAQYLWWHEPSRRQAAQRRKERLYRRAAPLLVSPAELLSVDLDELSIPGFLRIPSAAAEPRSLPCVMLLGGMESTKEESYHFENMLLRRGVATCTFDGPGQGELFEEVGLSADFNRYSSAVLDYLRSRPEINPDAIAVLGRSLGGLYALQAAAMDTRFAACVSWGGCVDMDYFDAETPLTKEGWRYIAKVDTMDEARDFVRTTLDLRPVLSNLTCPTYFLHGALDPTPMSEVDLLRELAVNAPLTVVVEPDGIHCVHNLGPVPRLRMVDWLVVCLVNKW